MMESGPLAPAQADDGGRPKKRLRLETHAPTETACASSQTLATTGQLRAKIDSLIRGEQVPNLDDPEARSELLRGSFVHNIWPDVKDDYKRMMEELKELLVKGLVNEGIHAGLFARIKEVESIKKSLQRRDDHLFKEKGRRFESFDDILRHIYDLVGLRIVLLFRDQLTKAKEFVERTFMQLGDPTYFSPDREVGQQWKKFEFGAYETYNYRLSHLDGQSRDVTFEVQLTTFGGHLFNMLGHPFLYKSAFGPLSKGDEMVLDQLHGSAISFGLGIQQLLEGRLGPPSQMQNIQQGNKTMTHDLISRIIRETEITLSHAMKGMEGDKTPAVTGNQGCAEEQLSKLLDRIRIAVDEITCDIRNAESRIGGEFTNRPILPCHHIPLYRNKHFVGRGGTLATLQQKLFIQRECQKASIVGLGGVGKTQVALQLAYWAKKHRPEYSIFWVPALSEATFEQAYTEMARKLRLQSVDTNEDPKVSVRRYLSSEAAGPWLLIVDNADDADLFFGPSDMPGGLNKYLPDSEDGLVLFTTRVKKIAVSVARSGVVIKLSEMEPQEAADYLEKLLIQKDLLRDEGEAKELLKELTYLPLAITQAAAYLNETEISVTEYLRLLRGTEQNAASLMKREFLDDNDSWNAVATTWLVSFEQVRISEPPAADLLSFLSCVEPKAIPQSMLPRPEVEEQMVHAIGTLCGYAFLTRRGNSRIFDMHSLVHLATRIWIQKGGRTATTHEKAIRHLLRVFPDDDYANRSLWREYLPHVFKALQGGEGVNTEEEADLRYWVGRCLRADGRIKEAVKYLEKDSQWKNGHFAEDHPSRLASQHALAGAYQADGQIKKAVALLEAVVAIRTKTLAEDHPDRLASQHSFAVAYQADGQITKAVALLEQVVAIEAKTLAENHPERLASEEWLAYILETASLE